MKAWWTKMKTNLIWFRHIIKHIIKIEYSKQDQLIEFIILWFKIIHYGNRNSINVFFVLFE
jgi:hypothetical protein